MVSCYDCEHFGTRCNGIVPPMEYKDRIDEYCALFVVVPWKANLYSTPGGARIS